MGQPSTQTRAIGTRRAALLASTSLLAALAAAPRAPAQQALPTQGSVASGAATIKQSGSAMTIDQASARAVINWGSYSIGPGASVTYAQPDAGSATLNRVTGSTPSSIAGSLKANGQVYLVNPNGIAITRGGTVNVGGGFVASTLAVSDSDFNRGALTFRGGGASAPVSNAGTITTAPGGFVGLLGGSVSNSGTISAPIGKIGLGSGEQATLDLNGDGFLQVALPTNAQTADGKALVDVTGAVRAAGGTVAIKAATAASAVRNAINLSGYASAHSARAVGGSIVLDGGAGGDVRVSGRLDASGRSGGSVRISGGAATLAGARVRAVGRKAKGGAVAVTATHAVKLRGASVDVSGATGGGAIAIGGSPRGLGPLASAATTTVDGGSVLRADALTVGDGGTVTLWSKGATTAAGLITARGGAQSGDGGAVETSGAALDVNGLSVDTTAAKGATGTWLLDPVDFTIAPAGGDMTGATLSGELATTNVTIMSGDGATGANGDINVNDAVAWSAATTLTLDAYRNVNINAPIQIAGAGGLSLVFGDTAQYGTGSAAAGAYAFNAPGSTSAYVGRVSYTGSGGALTIESAPYTLVNSESGLQAMAGSRGDYALANAVTLTSGVSDALVSSFSGNFAGLGNTISGLAVNATGAGPAGMFGTVTSTGVVRDFTLGVGSVKGGAATGVGAVAGVNDGTILSVTSSVAVTGTGAQVGGVAGLNAAGATLSSSNVLAPVAGGSSVGGVAGENDGAVVKSIAFGAVTGSTNVGGLVGLNTGSITVSYASGAVAGATDVGGLVGANTGAGALIQDAYATGATSGSSDVGGLVGLNGASATVDVAYSTGAVSGTTGVGGLVGANAGAVTDGYWDTDTSGQSGSAGGTGLTTAQLQGGATEAFDSSFAGGAAGGQSLVYPYLTYFFSSGVITLDGFAYKDPEGTTPLASTTAGPGTVYVDIAGRLSGNTTTGANGYYYFAAPKQLLALLTGGGLNGITYTLPSAGAGSNYAATYFVVTGANVGNENIYGSTLSEITAETKYSTLAAGLANAVGSDPGGGAALGGVSYIDIAALGAGFTVDTPITTSANLQISGVTTLAANISATGGVRLSGNGSSPISLASTVTIDSGAAGTAFGSAIDGSAAPGAGLTVNGPVTLSGDVTTSNGALAFNGPVTIDADLLVNSGTAATTFGSTVDSGTLSDFPGHYSLSGEAGAFSFGGAIGGYAPLGSLSLISASGLTLPAVTASGAVKVVTTGAGANLTLASVTADTIFAQTQGAGSNLALASGATLTASGQGASVQLVATGAFVNDAGPNAIDLAPTPSPSPSPAPTANWLVYSNNPNDDTFGGLNSNNRAIWNASFPDPSAPTSGNHYLFAYQPTVTFTSTSDNKTYGQDATAKVAQDFTVSGIEAGVSGAFLGDTAAVAYSGAPSVTSAGSPASATVAGGPYPITVAQGSLAALDGYQFAFVSNGALTVNPEAITVTAAPNAKTYDSATSAAAAPTVTAGTLYDAATLSEAYAAPNAGTGLALDPQIAFASPGAAGNYIVTLAPANTGSINPEPITITATPNTKTFDGNTSAAALPALTAGTLFDPATLSEVYATPNPGDGIVLTPAIAFADPRAATNYQITLVPTGTTPPDTGVIRPPAFVSSNLNPSVFANPTRAPTTALATSPECVGAADIPQIGTFAEPGAAVQAISATVSQHVERCRDVSQEEIADALDRYADALEIVIQRLPPKLRASLRHIPAMVRAAAVRARAAPTRAAAVRVLKQTVAEVHREIMLVRAEDPDSARIRNAVSAGVSGVLNSAAVALAHAEGI